MIRVKCFLQCTRYPRSLRCCNYGGVDSQNHTLGYDSQKTCVDLIWAKPDANIHKYIPTGLRLALIGTFGTSRAEGDPETNVTSTAGTDWRIVSTSGEIPRGVRLRAGAIDISASRTLTPIRSNRDGLGEPLDVRNIVRLRGEGIPGIQVILQHRTSFAL